MTIKPLTAKSPCKVWLIRRESDQTYLVLKLAGDSENLASLMQENVGLKQKYVVDFYGMLSTDFGEGLLMEYCPGGSLASLVRQRSAVSLGEAVTALAPIAQTISGLHASGIRHGDISPENILLTASGMPKIIDFQESALAAQSTQPAGTPGFIAPEVFSGAPEASVGEQDVFALGACLWFLLSGNPPEETICRPPVRLKFPDVPEIIQCLIADSLCDDPYERPTAEQFARTLFSSTQAEPIHWEGYIDTETNHLMETIHPVQASKKRSHESKRSREGTLAEPGWQGHALHRTPGARRIAASVLIAAGVVAASFFGVSLLSSGQQAQSPAVAAEQSMQEPCRIKDVAQVPACAMESDTVISSFVRLSNQRDQAINSSDSKALSRIYAKGSEQLVRDQKTVEDLGKLGLHIQGLHTSLQDLHVVARGQGDEVVLGARSSMSGYTYVDKSGKVRHEVEAGDEEWIKVQVKLVDGQWRLGNVISRQK